MSETISVQCPGCGHRLHAPTEHAGKLARCSKCRKVFTLPTRPAVVTPPPLVQVCNPHNQGHRPSVRRVVTPYGMYCFVATCSVLATLVLLTFLVSGSTPGNQSPTGRTPQEPLTVSPVAARYVPADAPPVAERAPSQSEMRAIEEAPIPSESVPVASGPAASTATVPTAGTGPAASAGTSEGFRTVVPAPVPPAVLTTEEIVRRCEPSVARVKGKFSSGAEFLIQPNLLVTNSHVVADEFIDNLQVHFPSADQAHRGPLKATLVYRDADRDLALLSVTTPLPALELADAYEFSRGQDVLVIGSPAAGDGLLLENALARGVMSTETTIGDRRYYQLGIAVNPGNSGGPVLDQQGRVIGVVTGKAAEREGLAFAIPPDDLRAALDVAAGQTQEERLLIASRHRAVTAFRFIQACGTLYAGGLDRYVGAIEQAIQQGQKPDEGIRQASAQIDSGVNAVDQKFSSDLARSVSAISSDPHLTAFVREQMVELWTTYRQMKAMFDRPEGTYQDYRAQLVQLKAKHRQLTDSLQALLGVENLIQITFTDN